MNLVLCRDCRGEYPDTSLEGGRCWACALRANPPRALDGTEPPAPEPVWSWRFDPCVDPACGRFNRRLASEPALRLCPGCGGPVLSAMRGLGNRRGRLVAVDGDTDV